MTFDFKALKTKAICLWNRMEPIQGVIIFLVVMFASNFLWKIMIQGDENSSPMFFGLIDISAPFIVLSHWLAIISNNILHIFNFQVKCIGESICYTSGIGIKVIWGCTAIKQSFIFLCIMLASRGLWNRKLWYIPIGLILIQIFNVLRIVIIVALIKDHPEKFHLFHENILKYAFYAFIFLIWVLWEEKFSGQNKK